MMTTQEAYSALRCAAHEAKIDVGRCTVAYDPRERTISMRIAGATDDECELFRSEASKLFPSFLVTVTRR